MKQFILASTLTVSLCFTPATTDAMFLENNDILTISPNHSFTVTFSDSVNKNKALIEEISILTTSTPVLFTTVIHDNMITLNPIQDLEQNKMYTVEVTLANGDITKQQFFTTADEKTPLSTFLEQYPTLKDSIIIATMIEQTEELARITANDEQPSVALRNAVESIPANIELFKQSVQQTEQLYKVAEAFVTNANSNEVDAAIQLESLNTLLHNHLLNANSLSSLNKAKLACDNAVKLLKATSTATEAGLELISMLEELNNAISDILLVAPASTEKIHYIDTLQAAFTKGIGQVAASDSTIAKQMSSIESLLESTTDYMYVIDEAHYFIADIESYQQQFATWKDAKDVKNVVSAYNKLQTAIQTINNKISSTSNISSIEATLSSQMDIVDELTMDIPTYIDTYLEEQITSLTGALETVEESADEKGIDYYATDSYHIAYDAILTIESNYSFYDGLIVYTDFKETIADAHAKVKALKRELGV